MKKYGRRFWVAVVVLFVLTNVVALGVQYYFQQTYLYEARCGETELEQFKTKAEAEAWASGKSLDYAGIGYCVIYNTG
jgi:hypothetical protein